MTVTDRPNVLWLTLEDTSPQFLGCYGNPAARTPAMDTLARSGVRFTHAYATGTVCSPSRSTLITGARTYELGTGHHRSHYPIPGEVRGFPALLRQQGYYTTNNVKTDYNTSAHDRLVAESWDESSDRAGWWDRQSGQPFFSVFNFMQSHQSWTMTLPYDTYAEEVLARLPLEQRTPDDGFAMPPFLRDSPEMRRQLARVYNSLTLTDRYVDEILRWLDDDGLAEDTIVFLFADHGEGIPRGKTNGIGLGYRVPLIISIPERWQRIAPWSPGTASAELVSLEDLPPTLVDLATGSVPGYMHGRTILGGRRALPPAYCFGSSDRSDESTDLERSVFDGKYVYTRHFMPHLPELRWMKYHDVSDIRTVMRGDHAAGVLSAPQARLFGPRPAESLYDLDEDPWEQRNLAADPSYQGRLVAFRQALARTMVGSRDVMLLPEYELARISAHSTPYDYRLDDDRYPFDEICRTADLCGRIDPMAHAAQLAALHAANPIVRYWAVLGLRSQPVDALLPGRTILTRTLHDDYPPARIIGAALCWERFGEPAAAQLLRSACLDADPRLALLALQEIHLAADLRPFADVVEAVAAGAGATDGYNLRAITDMLRWRLGGIHRPGLRSGA